MSRDVLQLAASAAAAAVIDAATALPDADPGRAPPNARCRPVAPRRRSDRVPVVPRDRRVGLIFVQFKN